MAGVVKSVNRAVVLGDELNGWCGQVCKQGFVLGDGSMAGVVKSVNRAVVLGDRLNGWCELCL